MILLFPHHHPLHHNLIALTLLTSVITQAAATCYWPNATLFTNNPDPSTISTDDHPCFPNAANSVCCGTGWTCLSDGVCLINQQGSDFYYRGTCTDSTWKSQSCPGFCFQQNNATTEPLGKCNTPNADWYCCDGDNQCDCDTGKFAVQLNGPATTVTVIGSKETPTLKAASSSSTSTRASASTSLPQSTSSATALATPQPAPSSDSHGTAIGVGVGVAVGVSLIAVIGFFLWRRRSRQKKRGDAVAVSEQHTDGLHPKERYGVYQAVGTPIHEVPGTARYNGRNVGEERQELPDDHNARSDGNYRAELPVGSL